jgi:cytochrome c-type biogenesis protein CcmF
VQYKPLIRYIWLGAWIMALGGLVATLDRRYRVKHVTEQAPAAGAMARESG